MKSDETFPWYGFTEDKVFGWVMEDKEFCKHVLQIILPDIKIAKIENLYLQKQLEDSDRDSKDICLDVLVTDTHGRIYNCEMQVADHHNLGQRMRYYLSKADSHYALKKGSTYNDLKESYIIFLCDFDYLGKNRVRYSFHEYEDEDKTLMLPTSSAKIIINSKGKLAGNSKGLQNLVKLMKGERITGDKYFDYAQEKIIKINQDPRRRVQIMDYETKLLEQEQKGERIGQKIGQKIGQQKRARIALSQSVKRYTTLGLSKQQILDILLQDYGDILSEEEIHKAVE